MAKRKKQSAPAKPVQPNKKKGAGVSTWIAAVVAVVAIVGLLLVVSRGGSLGAAAGSPSATAPAPSAQSGPVPPEEAKYIGRLLPAGYVEASVAPAAGYSSVIKMTDLTATQNAKQFSIPTSDVVANKIVYFEYKSGSAGPIPMVAYVKPSGKLFVGVGYCLPCKGTRQRIEADGTLTCEACGTKRDLETGVGLSGTCRLYPLDEVPAKVANGKIAIDDAVLEKWSPQPSDRPVGA